MKSRTEKIFLGVFLLLAVFYVAIIIRLVFMKDGIRLETDAAHFMPFGTLLEYKHGIRTLNSVILNYVGNIALFVPLGIILPIIFKKLNFLNVIFTGFLVSAFIEIAQYMLSVGCADTDDIIMNTLGAAIGAFIYFYILGGKHRSILSYILSLVVIFITAVGGMTCIWRYAPNLLPSETVAVSGMIAGRRVDSYNLYAKCKGMSHGEVAVDKRTATDSAGEKVEGIPRSYFISDTAVFVMVIEKNGKRHYNIVGRDEMIEKITEREKPYLKIWLDDENKCSIIMLV